MAKNRKVIYTCLVGGYDSLRQPEVTDDTFDYVCFTNDLHAEKEGVWAIRPIPYADPSASRVSRYAKLLPHQVLAEYDYSVYMDATVQIVQHDFYEAVNQKIADGCLVAQVRHTIPPIDCIYDEIVFAYKFNVVTLLQAWRQTRHLKRNQFPRHFGLFENNLILRRHNHPEVQRMMEEWWQEYCAYGPRDQFTLMYVYWKNHYMPDELLGPGVCVRNSPWLRLHRHLWQHHDDLSLAERVVRRFHQLTYPYVKYLFI